MPLEKSSFSECAPVRAERKKTDEGCCVKNKAVSFDFFSLVLFKSSDVCDIDQSLIFIQGITKRV